MPLLPQMKNCVPRPSTPIVPNRTYSNCTAMAELVENAGAEIADLSLASSQPPSTAAAICTTSTSNTTSARPCSRGNGANGSNGATGASMMECPVCFDAFSPTVLEKFPVVVCRAGHSICYTCAEPVHYRGTCPICRKLTLPNGGIINRLAIEMLAAQHRAVSRSDSVVDNGKNVNEVVTHSSPSGIESLSSESTLAAQQIDGSQEEAVPTDKETESMYAAEAVEGADEGPIDILADDLFGAGAARCFYGSYEEQGPLSNGEILTVDWLCKLVLKSVQTREEFDVWIEENEYTVLNENDEICMMSRPEDVGTGSILLIGHITWTNSTLNLDFNCDDLHSAFELVAGTYDPKHRLLCLRGIGVRQMQSLVAATGYMLHVSRDGKYVRGWTRGGLPDADGLFEFTPNLVSFATKINLEEVEGF
jgi:hypothetical protein